MILVDSSAWVEYDRATGSAVDEHLTFLIQGDGDISVTEPILMEVLAGARDRSRHADLRNLLTSFHWTPADPATDFEGAATLYRVCRAAGVTPRGLIDCMIATIAIRSGSHLLAIDGDFAEMAAVVPLRLAKHR